MRFRLLTLATAAVLVAALPAIAGAAGKEDCDALYFGIGRPPDFSKALKCYEAEKSWELLILMHLNGEGTPADAQKAGELLQSWQKADPSQADSMQAEALRNAIAERKQNPGETYPRLDYCQDIAGDTMSLNFCAWIDERLAEVDFKAAMARTRSNLAPADAAIFDKVLAEFAAFKEAEAGRMYQRYIDGTIRDLAASGQAAFVREQFLSLIRETVEQRRLAPADEKAYKAADLELNQVYRDDVRSNEASEYRKHSKDAQLHWIRYRDLLADLARSLYKDRQRELDPAVSMKTAVTRVRVRELRNDPVAGPGE